jgi:PAS domain S-box-containing protein
VRSKTTLTLLLVLILLAGLTRLVSLRFFMAELADDDSLDALAHRGEGELRSLELGSNVQTVRSLEDAITGIEASANKLSPFVVDSRLQDAIAKMQSDWRSAKSVLQTSSAVNDDVRKTELEVLRSDLGVVLQANDQQRIILRSRMWTSTFGVGLLNLLTILIGLILMKRAESDQRSALEQVRNAADKLEQNERELRANEAKYRTLVENMDEILIRVETRRGQHKVTFVGPQLESILGYQPGDFVADPARARGLFQADEVEALTQRCQEVLGGASVIDQLRIRHRNGNPIWFEAKAGPVRDENGAIVGFQVLLRDVDEQHRAKETRELLERQLQQAQKMETVGRLAGGVAHDFNNLLTVILGYSRIMLEPLAPEHPDRAFLEAINKAGERGANVARQLLAFSRKTVLQSVPINLNSSINNTASMLREVIGADIQLDLNLCPDLEMVEADLGHMDQVLMNLLVNARDAMPEGGAITIATRNVVVNPETRYEHPEAEDGAYVMLSVTDDGVGMDGETQKHIFEPFFTTKEVGKGTGLGLATVYGIVQQSKGYIGFSSEFGKGTQFRIYLPQVCFPVLSSCQHTGNVSAAVPPQQGTVLLVEDEGDVRRLAAHIIRNNGYDVIEAPNGSEALHILLHADAHVDVLLTDIIMPGMTGRELATQALPHCPTLKVLYMSGYTRELLGQHAIVGSDDNVIYKPFSADDLLRGLRNLTVNACL